MERPVVVTTEYRGVFFGYASNTDGDTVKLKRARNCLYWSSGVRGFLGLAVTGPDKKCRVGPAASVLELRRVTAVVECSEEAVRNWELEPWGE